MFNRAIWRNEANSSESSGFPGLSADFFPTTLIFLVNSERRQAAQLNRADAPLAAAKKRAHFGRQEPTKPQGEPRAHPEHGPFHRVDHRIRKRPSPFIAISSASSPGRVPRSTSRARGSTTTARRCCTSSSAQPFLNIAGVLDHIAFSGTNLPSYLEKLSAKGLRYDLRRLPGKEGHAGGTWQLFFLDPSGAKVEIDFSPTESAEGL